MKRYKRILLKSLLIISLSVFILSIISLVYLFATKSDAKNDIKLCEYKSLSSIEIDSERSFIGLDIYCYANDDFWKINLGHNIECTCYYYHDNGYGVMGFTIE